MYYAKKSLGLLSPLSLSKCTPASPRSRTRPYRVSSCDRTQRKGIMAESLEDLREKARAALQLFGDLSLVLDEDGTSVETEEFFQTLEEGTVLVGLTKGQRWCPPPKGPGYQLALSHKPPRRIDVACVTFDFYKTDPRDFIGCLNVKATLYGIYSMSYDMQCYGAKRIMKEALRWTLFTMQATGHVLLGTSCYVQQLLDATDEQKEEDLSAGCHLRGLPARKMLQ